MRTKKGFTLVEITIGLVIASILLLIVGTIQVTSVKFWLRGEAKVALQSEASFLFACLTPPVREATNAAVSSNGQTLTLTKNTPEGILEWTKKFYREGNNLKYQLDAQTSEILILGTLDSLAFTHPADKGNVGIAIVLYKSGESFSLQKTLVMRNFGLH